MAVRGMVVIRDYRCISGTPAFADVSCEIEQGAVGGIVIGIVHPSYTRAYIRPTRDASRRSSRTTPCV